ncbi:MAG: AAA family ATPase [Kofleriaceae bacterium]
MRITCVQIQNYKRVHKVAITPSSDKALVLIGGKNGQGKSSTLDALTAAFGGKRAAASDPVRHGAEEAAIFVELDGGKLTIDRTIAPDGSTTLEVRDQDGAIKSPQSTLDRLVGARFLDPLAFLNLQPKEQRAQLMRLIPEANRIDTLNEKRERAFARRTEIGRELTKAEGELARLPEVEVGKAIDVAAINEEMRTFTEQQRAGDKEAATWNAEDTLAMVDRADLESTRQRIERLERELAELRAQLPVKEKTVTERDQRLAGLKAKVTAAAKVWTDSAPRRAQLEADLKRADEHNRAVYAAEAQNKRRAEVADDVAKRKAEVDEITAALAKIDARKAEILAAAKLPVEGLSVTDEGVTLAGVPFVQASASERYRVALALAIAASPGLDDVWIRDGALLDEESLELVAKHAEAAGRRVWLERVGTQDAGAIVIADGKVVS